MAAAQPNALKSFRGPLVGTFQNRNGTTSKDQHFINCFPESVKAPINDQKKIYLYQRPGTTTIATVAASQVGRGVKWFNGKYFSVFGNKLYKTTTSGVSTAIQTLTTSTGQCSLEIGTVQSGNVLVIADGVYVYVVDESDVVTTVPLTLTAWASGHTYAADDRVVPTVGNGFYYQAIDGGVSAGTEPTWPIYLGETVVDGGITWEAKGYTNTAGPWQAGYDYQVGQQVKVTLGGIDYLQAVSAAGKSGATAPAWTVELGGTTIDNLATWTCLGEFRDDSPPKYNEPSLAFLDGYMFLTLKKTDGSKSADIYNCDLDNPFSWNPVNYVVAEQFPDNLSALARQNNMLVAFGESSTEFFYDAANSVGTPLARNTSYTLQVGIAAPYAIYQSEKFCLFLGQSDSGGRAVWMLDGFVPKKVSDEYIERICDTLTEAQLQTVTGYGLRTNGHLFFVLNLPTRSLVYDLEERMWHEWTGLACNNMTDNGSGKAILQHATNGKLYYMDPTVGTDDGVNISMEVFTTKFDFDTMNIKSLHSLNIVSDLETNETIDIRWSDDDYNTWSSWRTLALYPRSFYVSLGSFRRRAFNVKFTGGVPLRLEAFEFDVRLWKA